MDGDGEGIHCLPSSGHLAIDLRMVAIHVFLSSDVRQTSSYISGSVLLWQIR